MDRLTRNEIQQARKQADLERQRKALGDSNAMTEALQRALAARQPTVSTQPTESPRPAGDG